MERFLSFLYGTSNLSYVHRYINESHFSNENPQLWTRLDGIISLCLIFAIGLITIIICLCHRRGEAAVAPQPLGEVDLQPL